VKRRVCLAVDLGAGSGRVVAGIYDGETLSLREIRRFPNDPTKEPSGWHWNIEALFDEIKNGISVAARDYGSDLVSVGVDSWGVDYGLLDGDGQLLGKPFQYRDVRTEGKEAEATSRMPREEIYRRTGIQFMFFNTLFQLLAERAAPQALLEKADRLLFMPDLFHFLLTGQAFVERSIASTSQLLNAATGQWDIELIHAMGLPPHVFGEIVDAGTILGEVRADLREELGVESLQVIAPGAHDTASAVAGVPAAAENPVFLSSGTWSLLGRELAAPILTDAAREAGFSNEAGVFGTTRFLKNIPGMWLLQECKRIWDAGSAPLSYDELIAAAAVARPFAALIDPEAPEFQAPADMPASISAWLQKTGQPLLSGPGQITRVILESLALKYRQATELLAGLTRHPIDLVHIVGGGAQNRLLNQFAADAMKCPVLAGPVEATSAGNILLQLIALGDLSSLEEGRALIRRSFEAERFEPRNSAAWDAVYPSFIALQNTP
jgi:sugar (pentulose or hexulose) kinase